VLYAVPTQLKLLLATAMKRDRHRDESNLNPLSSVRWVLSSGSRWFLEITSDLQRLFPNAVIGEFYGASELSYVSVAKHGLDPNLRRGSVGRAFFGVQIEIIDQKIWVHSEGLFTRYCVSHPADFSERTDEQGRRWLSVGDLGVMDTNGYLFLSGRESRKIIVSGKNLYPEEVEEAIESHPWVQRAAVLSRPDAVRGERLLAMIQPRELIDQTSDDSLLSGERLRQTFIEHLRPLLEDFKIPRDYRLVMNWPTTPTGKTNFAALGEALN